MGRKMNVGQHGGGEEGGHGGDRPWVFFMVDCFFLITEFFVLTFKFKSEEAALPQRLPPGGTASPNKSMARDAKETLRVHVAAAGGNATYDVMGNPVSVSGLNDTLANAARNGGDKYSVKVSYDAQAQWGDVIAVFNACNKVKIAECGLVPLRGE
jgi:biopolymer transport protein ExbD